MAVYQRVLQHTASRVESPAKVFAKLKSKVDREASCGKDGIYSCKDLLGKVKEKLGADFKSLRKSTECNWISDEFNENGGYGSVCEARPLTISPMSSPQRHFGYSRADRSGKLAEDALSVDERGRGCTPRKGRFLDSTAKPQPFSPANRTQSLTEPLLVRDAFDVIHRTQRQRIQEAENEFMLEEVRPPPMPSSCVFSPMRSKLRKRKLESRGLHNTNSKTRQVDCEPCPLWELQSPRNTRGTDPVHLRGFPARQLDKNQLAHEPVFPAAGFPAKTRKRTPHFAFSQIFLLLFIRMELTDDSAFNRKQRGRGQSSPDVSSQDVCLHEGEGESSRAGRKPETHRLEETVRK